MFNDKRSKKVVIVSHCLLNQNAKIDRCAHLPGMVPQILLPLLNAGIGVIQMPCPEVCILGLDRQADDSIIGSIEDEDTRVASLMKGERSLAFCRMIALDMIKQIREYERHGFIVTGVLGVNGSPTCGVESNFEDGKEKNLPGVLTSTMMREFEGAEITIPFRGVKVYREDTMKSALQDLGLINPDNRVK